MKRSFLLSVLILSVAAYTQITVATAANMQFAMEEIAAAFKKESGKEVKTVYGASGKLATQIRSGAPFDLFVSADLAFPDTVVKSGLAVGKPEVYAYGTLVLWTLKDYDLTKGLGILKDTTIAKIAIGDPKLTVYGPAAIQAMQKSAVYDAVKGKLVFGDNISQVAQYITTQSADIGFNAKSIVLSGPMAGKGKWVEIKNSDYEPIAQGAIILKYGNDNNKEISDKFFKFLFSPAVRTILSKYGYGLPELKK